MQDCFSLGKLVQAAGDLSNEGLLCTGGLEPARAVAPLHVAYPSLCGLEISPRADATSPSWAEAAHSVTLEPPSPPPASQVSNSPGLSASMAAEDCPVDNHRTQLPRATSSTNTSSDSEGETGNEGINKDAPDLARAGDDSSSRRVRFAAGPAQVMLFTVENQPGQILRRVPSKSRERKAVSAETIMSPQLPVQGRGGQQQLCLQLQRCVQQAAAMAAAAASLAPEGFELSPRIRIEV